MIVAVAFGAKEKLTAIFRIWLKDRGQRRLPFVIGFLGYQNYLLALATDIVNIKKLSPLCVLVVAVHDQARPVSRPNHAAETAHALGLWQLDLERRVAAAVGRYYKKLLFGPAPTNRARLDKFVEVTRYKKHP